MNSNNNNSGIIIPVIFAMMFFITGITISMLFFPSGDGFDMINRVMDNIGQSEYMVDSIPSGNHDMLYVRDAPLELNDVENDRFSFDVDYREEMHPSIRPLEYRYKASTALSAKFR